MPDFDRVTIEDAKVPGMLHGSVVRSRIRRGSVRLVKLPTLPDGYYSVRESDISGLNSMSIHDVSMPLLSESELLFPGQAILLLCGPDPRVVAQLASSVEIQYERSEALELKEPFPKEQVVGIRSTTKGNMEAGFSRATQIIEGEYVSDSVSRREMDPLGALAVVEESGVRVLVPSRWIYHVRDTVAAVLARNPQEVSVTASETGGIFDGFVWNPSLVACYAALLAIKAGAPVRVLLTRKESQNLLCRSTGVQIRHKTGLDNDGVPTAMDIDIAVSAGAYALFADELLDRLMLSAAGLYTCSNVAVSAALLRTNTPPHELFTGFGFEPAFFALEVHATRIAELVQEDPCLWRKQNLPDSRQILLAGDRSSAIHPEQLLDAVASDADFERKHAANEMLKKRRGAVSPAQELLRGVGIAWSYQGGGFLGGDEPGGASLTVRLDPSGNLDILTSTMCRPGTTDVMLQREAETILGLKKEQVRILPAVTSLVPDTGPSMLARNVTIVRRLAQLGCQSIQKKRFRSPLPLEVTRSHRKSSRLSWNSKTCSGTPFSTLSACATVVEVEIDPVTLEISVRGVWLTAEVGRIVDERITERSVELEIAQTIEWCRGDEVRWEASGIHSKGPHGRQTRSVPPVSVKFLNSRKGNPGVVEGLAFCTVAPAFVAAVSQATGFYFDSLPLTTSIMHQYVET